MDPEGSLLCLQESVIGSYPEVLPFKKRQLLTNIGTTKQYLSAAALLRFEPSTSGVDIQTGSGAPLNLLAIGIGLLSSRLKQPGREADHSPPPSAELYLHSPIHLHGVVLN
jgi:hypothetical protein